METKPSDELMNSSSSSAEPSAAGRLKIWQNRLYSTAVSIGLKLTVVNYELIQHKQCVDWNKINHFIASV